MNKFHQLGGPRCPRSTDVHGKHQDKWHHCTRPVNVQTDSNSAVAKSNRPGFGATVTRLYKPTAACTYRDRLINLPVDQIKNIIENIRLYLILYIYYYIKIKLILKHNFIIIYVYIYIFIYKFYHTIKSQTPNHKKCVRDLHRRLS